MKNKLFKLAATLLLMGPLAAFAVPIQIGFTASGFGAGAPLDPVESSFVVDSSDGGDTINGFLSSEMELGGQVYLVDTFQYGYASDPIAGTGWFVDVELLTTAPVAGDFFANFRLSQGILGDEFTISYGTDVTVYTATSLSVFIDTGSLLVPEPGSLALLGVGVFALGFSRRRRRYKAF